MTTTRFSRARFLSGQTSMDPPMTSGETLAVPRQASPPAATVKGVAVERGQLARGQFHPYVIVAQGHRIVGLVIGTSEALAAGPARHHRHVAEFRNAGPARPVLRTAEDQRRAVLVA